MIGRDYHSLKPIEQSNVTVGVSYDPVALTTNSGVALLKDAVTQAAVKACADADRSSPPDQTCIQNAVDQAQPQVARVVAQARGRLNG